jgi:hypothetical protein
MRIVYRIDMDRRTCRKALAFFLVFWLQLSRLITGASRKKPPLSRSYTVQPLVAPAQNRNTGICPVRLVFSVLREPVEDVEPEFSIVSAW